MEEEVEYLNVKEEDKLVDDFSASRTWTNSYVVLGAEDFVLLVGAEESVTLVDAEKLLLVVEEEEEVKLLHADEDKLLLVEVSQCAPLGLISVILYGG